MDMRLEIIKSRIETVNSARHVVTTTMEKVFPKGRKIVFKRNNMKMSAQAIVIWASMRGRHAELRITNTQTGKDSTIFFSDVVGILKPL